MNYNEALDLGMVDIIKWVKLNKTLLIDKVNLLNDKTQNNLYSSTGSSPQGYFSPSIVRELLIGGNDRGKQPSKQIPNRTSNGYTRFVMNESGLPIFIQMYTQNRERVKMYETVDYFEGYSVSVCIFPLIKFVSKIDYTTRKFGRIEKIISMSFLMNFDLSIDNLSSVEIESYEYDDETGTLFWKISKEPYSSLLTSVRKKTIHYKLKFDDRGNIISYITENGNLKAVKKRRNIYDNFAIKQIK